MTAGDECSVLVRTEQGACIVTLNRPRKRNALTLHMLHAITDAARNAAADAQVRALIVHGGPSLFCAGADLDEVLALRDPAAAADYFGHWHRLTRTLEESRLPIIAAIEGHCLTGGLELALAADLRIAGAGASFAITSARIGTLAGAGATQRLPRIVGPAKALEMLLGAEPVTAAEAHRIGLVNRVVDAGAALREALACVRVYGERAPMALAFAKQAVYGGLQMDLACGLALETRLAAAIYGTQDKHEGVAAFLDKRAPRFRGC
jgi:enoyl-CoA hydratase/carnithine racemase